MESRTRLWGNTAGHAVHRPPPRTNRIHIHRRNGFLNRAASALWAYRNPSGIWLSGLLASRYCRQRSRALQVTQEMHDAKKGLNQLPTSHPKAQPGSHQCDPEPAVRLDWLVPHCSALNQLDLVSIWVCNKGDDGIAAQNRACFARYLTTRRFNRGASSIGIGYTQSNVAISCA